MQFIIDNQAWFLLIAGVTLLAVIGKIAEMRNEARDKETASEPKEDKIEEAVESHEEDVVAEPTEDAIEESSEVVEEETVEVNEADDGLTDSGEDLSVPLEANPETEEQAPTSLDLDLDGFLAPKEIVNSDFGFEPKAEIVADSGFGEGPAVEKNVFAAEADEFGLNELPTLRTGQDTPETNPADDDGVWEFK